MSYDAGLAERVRKALAARGDVAEKRMMGVLCFMSGGHMCCGVTGAALGRENEFMAIAPSRLAR